MKKFALYLPLFIWLFTLTINASAQVPDEIVNGIRSGNAAKLSKFFNQNVELLVLDFECSCSKSQTQQVLNEFFTKYPPSKFTIVHKGGKGDSNYIIGTLETPGGKFRVSFLIKTINQVTIIHQLRIENQSE